MPIGVYDWVASRCDAVIRAIVRRQLGKQRLGKTYGIGGGVSPRVPQRRA